MVDFLIFELINYLIEKGVQKLNMPSGSLSRFLESTPPWDAAGLAPGRHRFGFQETATCFRLGNQQCEIIVESRFHFSVFAFVFFQISCFFLVVFEPIMLLVSASFLECVNAGDFVWV